MESNVLEKSKSKSVALRFFLHILFQLFDEKSKSKKLWINFSENNSDFSKEFYRLQIEYNWIAGQ